MAEKTLKLADGRSVPMEDGKNWPPEGAAVEVTLYIRRRLADGDLVECPPAVVPAAETPAEHPAAPPPAPAPMPALEPANEPDTETEQTGRKGRNGGK